MTWQAVTVTTAPVAMPITTAEMKERLRVDHSDEDSLISSLIAGAVARIDGPRGVGVAMMEQTWQLSLDCFPHEIRLPGWPITSVLSIKYDDTDGTEQTIDASNYRVDTTRYPTRVRPVQSFSWPAPLFATGVVRVSYQLGAESAADVPADLVDAVAMLVAEHYEHRMASSDSARAPLPYGAEMILAEYRQSLVA